MCTIEIIITFVDAHHGVLFIPFVLCFSSNITMFVYNVVEFIHELYSCIRWRFAILFDVCCRVCGATDECSDGRTHAAHSKNFRACTAFTLQPIHQTGEASCHRQPHDKVSAETVMRVVTDSGIPRSCRLHWGISCV